MQILSGLVHHERCGCPFADWNGYAKPIYARFRHGIYAADAERWLHQRSRPVLGFAGWGCRAGADWLVVFCTGHMAVSDLLHTELSSAGGLEFNPVGRASRSRDPGQADLSALLLGEFGSSGIHGIVGRPVFLPSSRGRPSAAVFARDRAAFAESRRFGSILLRAFLLSAVRPFQPAGAIHYPVVA